MFTLSARGRVQVTLARSGGPGRTGGTAGGVLRVALSARQGPNRYALATLLHGRRLARGRYTLTVRAGNRAVVLHLTV